MSPADRRAPHPWQADLGEADGGALWKGKVSGKCFQFSFMKERVERFPDHVCSSLFSGRNEVGAIRWDLLNGRKPKVPKVQSLG